MVGQRIRIRLKAYDYRVLDGGWIAKNELEARSQRLINSGSAAS